MVWLYLGAGIVIVGVWWLSKADPPPKAGVYRQPGKWYPVKYCFLRLMLWLRARQNERTKTTSGQNAGYGMRSRSSAEEMDKAQTLPKEHPKAVDAVYFNGGNKDGQFMVAATARRQNDVTQTILYVRLPEIGLLEMPSMPNTRLKATDKNGFAAGGLRLTPEQPMKTWKLSYSGPLVEHDTRKEYNVTLETTWEAFTDYFDFDTDLHPHTMADAIAREPWSREYFDQLKRVHQTHYEQFGEITGNVEISGHGKVEIKVQGVRDHSYGNIRDWAFFHRYALTYAALEDKTSICVGAISMPINLSRLHVGYVLYPDGRKENVSSVDFELYDAGEDGNPPKEHSLKFTAGGKEYNIKYEVQTAPIFYMGEERDAKIHERMCQYTVNGKRGWGISEWAYRNVAFDDKTMQRK